MTRKLTNEELIQRVVELEAEVAKHQEAGKDLIVLKRKYHAIFDNAVDSIFIVDPISGSIIDCNENAAKQRGYTKEELLKLKVFDINLEQMKPAILELFKKQVAGEKVTFEAVHRHKTGHEIPVEISSTLIEINGQKLLVSCARDISERKLAEEKLKRRSHELEEANSALKVLLKQSSEAKQVLEQKVLANIKDLIIPHVEELELKLSDKKEKVYINIIKSNLNQITSSFSHKLSQQIPGLSPREIQVIDFIKHGKTNKDIAELLNISIRTVETYRDNIRDKSGIKNKRVNLRSHLLSLN